MKNWMKNIPLYVPPILFIPFLPVIALWFILFWLGLLLINSLVPVQYSEKVEQWWSRFDPLRSTK